MSEVQVPTRDQVVERLFAELVGFGRVIKARGADWAYVDPQLTRGDVHALGVLAAHDGLRVGRLAAALNVDASVVSRQLVTLGDLGLVRRDADPADRRAELVSLTDAGHARLREVRGAMCAALATRLDDWDLADLDRAADLLGRLTRQLTPSSTKEHA